MTTLTAHDLYLATRFAGLDLSLDDQRIALRDATTRTHRAGTLLMGALFGTFIATTLLWKELLP